MTREPRSPAVSSAARTPPTAPGHRHGGKASRGAGANDGRAGATGESTNPRVRQPTKGEAGRWWPSAHDGLAELIKGYVARDGRSLQAIARAALLDVAYLWRLREGQRRRPSRDVLIRLALALHLEPEELDQLLVAAEYAPVTLRNF